MHNHDDKQGKGMMWMMMICCLAPIILLLIFGVGSTASVNAGNSKWLIGGVMGVMIILHLFMMRKSHKVTNEEDETKKENEQDSKNSCH